MALKPGRIPCVVIGCRRTAAADKYPEGTEIICGKCFRLAPRYMRRRMRRLERILRRMGITDWDQSRPNTKERRALILHEKAWKKLVERATQVKVGISA